MRKFYLFIGSCFLLSLFSNAQSVTPELINMSQLAQYEIAHPEIFGSCATCPKKEIDGGWKMLNANLPLPPNAIVKKQQQDNLRPQTPVSPQNPSPAPGQSFLGYVDPSLTIPPDTHGAVGTNHVITATNDYLIIHSKTGTQLSRVTLSNFAGLSGTCDPYIKFDPSVNRWFFSGLDCSTGANGNKLVIVVSASDDPTGNWFRYSFVAGSSFFLDHPYLGFDDRWLVVSGRKFANGSSYSGPVLYVLDKANLLANGTINFGTNGQVLQKGTGDGDAPLPVTVYGTNPSPNTFYILQNWSGNSGGNGLIRLSTVTGDIPNATWNTTGSGAVFPSSPQIWNSNTGTVAEQLGETRLLATNDARISSGVMVNGKIWCAHHVGITATNVAVQWWQLDGSPGASFGSVMQRGRIGEGLANNYRYFPSIAVNNNEDVIIGYSVSSNTSRISAAYSFRSGATAPNTTDDENIYKVGLSTYYKDFGARPRWGDYSHSAVDPTNGSLWTIQEYADQRVGTSDNSSRYGVWWAQVLPSSILQARDAAVDVITAPLPGLTCDLSPIPKVIIKNYGRDTLKTVDIGMMLDNVPFGAAATISNLSIPSYGRSSSITLSQLIGLPVGLHTLRIFTTNPNGGSDLRTLNDTISVSFTTSANLTLPYTEDFTNLTFPPDNGSAIINPDGPFNSANGTGTTWARTTAAGRPGPAAMWINNFAYPTAGQRDIYSLPKINAGELDSLVITFNVAYQQYLRSASAAASKDSLRLVYSNDCGVTWRAAGYAKGGSKLSTVNGTTSASFVPSGASQWRTERVVMKDIICSQHLAEIMIGFESYNDLGNNIYVDSINITGYHSFTNNAVLKSISKPLPALCITGFTPEVTFGNAGQDTLKALNLNYRIDNGPVNTVHWTGSLTKCSNATLALTSGTSTVGTHILTAYTSNPNGVADEATSNDTLRSTFSIYTTASMPLTEGFESSIFPTENWGVQNVNGGTTFERSENAGAAYTGTGVMRINNPAASNSNNAIDYFITPIVVNSATFDSVLVSFDLAYKALNKYPGSSLSSLDTLEILATKDCGASFISVWKKWGDALQTVTDTNTVVPFVPSLKSQWSRISIFLTPFVNSANFQLYFAMKGNKQNNLWLDNINITSKILPPRLKEQGYLIYPIPFNNSFLIHHSAVAPPVDLKSVQVYNAAGQLVWERLYDRNADRIINVNLENVQRGMYILKMIYMSKTIVERIIKN